ncbi:phosphopentomutase (plasmid) [Rhizobium sp. CB3171]|uniref:phosphopentomutase n=1 Tax=Rhizobium sp. CB3171 TaxID=3039157 RepID=UPI0024B0AD39|nr:phosphopentomutase [Rhizobium sp. CB3171]WFU06926.1 phosphopentomutase [Rhizobium sp. CB3171]
MSRAILCILDSVGIGGAPDAAAYGSLGADTVGHIARNAANGKADAEGVRSGRLRLPHLNALGLGAAALLSTGELPIGFSPEPIVGFYAVGREQSKGKDTPSGHWEIAGVPAMEEWGYFPQTIPAFSREFLEDICARAKIKGTLANVHASGTAVIEQYGAQSVQSGLPIFYTSADSVLQIAAHEEAFGLQQLYEVCAAAFQVTAPMRIGRVIARPFIGNERDGFKRTGNRRDFAIKPPEPTILDRVKNSGSKVFAVGKISDIFAGCGVTNVLKASGNTRLMDRTLEALADAQSGDLIVTNFVDFDQEFGHRRDVIGYAKALEDFDAALPTLLERLKPDDLLIITADHGNDPTWVGSDHTREQVPILCYSQRIKPGTGGVRDSFADIAESIASWLELPPGNHGRSFLPC